MGLSLKTDWISLAMRPLKARKIGHFSHKTIVFYTKLKAYRRLEGFFDATI